MLGQFGSQRSKALKGYRQFVMAGRGLPSPMLDTRHQLLLGDNAFVERHWQTKNPEELREVSNAHRRSVALSLDEYRMRHPDKDQAILPIRCLYDSRDRVPYRNTLHDGKSRSAEV